MGKKPPQDNEVIIGNGQNQRVFGPSTVIQINLKTLVVVLGLLLSGLTTAWYNITSKIERANEKTEKQIEKIYDKLETIKEQDLKQLRSDVDRMIGTSNRVVEKNQEEFRESNNFNSSESRPINNNRPEMPR